MDGSLRGKARESGEYVRKERKGLLIRIALFPLTIVWWHIASWVSMCNFFFERTLFESVVGLAFHIATVFAFFAVGFFPRGATDIQTALFLLFPVAAFLLLTLALLFLQYLFLRVIKGVKKIDLKTPPAPEILVPFNAITIFFGWLLPYYLLLGLFFSGQYALFGAYAFLGVGWLFVSGRASERSGPVPASWER